MSNSIARRVSDGAVVVDDEHDGRRVRFQTLRQLLRVVRRKRLRFGKKTLGKARQLLGPDGFIEMHTAAPGNLAQTIARDVTREDYGRDGVPEPLLHACNDLESIESLG